MGQGLKKLNKEKNLSFQFQKTKYYTRNDVTSYLHTMIEETCKVVIISAFDWAHVKYGVWIKAAPQP